MKTNKLLLVLALFGFSFGATAQGIKNHEKLSVAGMRFQHAVMKHEIAPQDKSSISEAAQRRYSIQNIEGELYFGALLKVVELASKDDFQKYGLQVNTQAGNIWSVKIPIDQLDALAASPQVEYIDISQAIVPKLAASRTNSKVDLVHAGAGVLNKANLGEGVVVGVVDAGFDYTHPMFYDTTGTQTRIKLVWDGRGNGNPPSGYTYGHEYYTEASILAHGYDVTDDSHGTHVAGCAAGSGGINRGAHSVLNKYEYLGMAPMADLVFVSYRMNAGNTAFSDVVLNGINYVFRYAEAEGKPSVVNLSLGTHLGPHDGSSLFDQGLNNLVGRGKIVVGAAGNEGMQPMYMKHDLDQVDEVVTFVGEVDDADYDQIELWGETGQDFGVSVLLYDSISGMVVDSTGLQMASLNTVYEKEILDGRGDTLQLQITLKLSDFNGEPHINIVYANGSDLEMALIARGSGEVDFWNYGSNNGRPFYDAGIAGLSAGTFDCSIGEIGGTADSIITVGAYTSKNQYTDLATGSPQRASFDQTLGTIAAFSSRGPSADGRLKPEVTAPGNVIISAVNRFHPEYTYTNPDVVDAIVVGNDTSYFGAQQGTSQAAPSVAGIIALWLENDPNMSVTDVKNILAGTSVKDAFTGVTSNNTWGHGKIDAYAGLLFVSVDEIDEATGQLKLFPNPAQDWLNISSDREKISQVEIYSVDGKQVLNQTVNKKSTQIDLSGISSGAYLIKILQGDEIKTGRLMIQH